MPEQDPQTESSVAGNVDDRLVALKASLSSSKELTVNTAPMANIWSFGDLSLGTADADNELAYNIR